MPSVATLGGYTLAIGLFILAATGWRRAFTIERQVGSKVVFWPTMAGRWKHELAKAKREPSRGFTTVGTMLLIIGLSLPSLVMVTALRSHVNVNTVTVLVWLASAGSAVCVLIGDKISRSKGPKP